MVPFVILLIALERKVIFAARGMYIVLAFFCGVAFVNGIQESKDRILKYKDYNAARIAFLEKHTSAGEAILFGDAASMSTPAAVLRQGFSCSQSPGIRSAWFCSSMNGVSTDSTRGRSARFTSRGSIPMEGRPRQPFPFRRGRSPAAAGLARKETTIWSGSIPGQCFYPGPAGEVHDFDDE
jgi:hypothetical protein